MIGTGILLKNMRPPIFECYMAFWTMTIYSDPSLSGITPIFYPITDLDLIPNLTFFLIARGFHRSLATGAACQQRTLTPQYTWSFPPLGLASVLMLRPITPELALFPDFRVLNIPRHFYFALNDRS